MQTATKPARRGWVGVQRSRNPLILALSLAAALLAGLAMAPSGARAQRGTTPCVSGHAGTPLCLYWTGKARWVDDGDTIHVDLDGDRSKATTAIRIAGIQAMELTAYSTRPGLRQGDCHSLEAAARLEHLIKQSKGSVRLTAQDAESRSRGRLLRSVAVYINKRWQDVGRILISEGHALWLPHPDEWAWNFSYGFRTQQAAARGLNLWSYNACAPGPSEVPLKLWVNWDADGKDSVNRNGEWVKVRNLDPVNPVPLGGWWVRDAGLRRFTFPAEAVLQPGGTATVHVGAGETTATEFHWGLTHSVFGDATDERFDSGATGDGAYLFDPDGDLRASMVYPCRVSCSNPGRDVLHLDVRYAASEESVRITNTGASPVDLEDYRLTSGPDVYPFGPDAVLAPGETMRVDVEGDPADDTRLSRSWGKRGPILRNAGDSVVLSTFTNLRADCSAWGDEEC